MQITIVTGLSGSGKSTAAKQLEDIGYFCIDNMPPQLVGELTRLLTAGESADKETRVALVMDTRTPSFVQHLLPVLEELQALNVPVRILFLEASDATLISRYKQSRRDHPLAARRSLDDAIRAERDLLTPVRELATDIIDTTDMTDHAMRERMIELFSTTPETEQLTVFLQSFGFKYGIPLDADIVMDVRFIPNPHYVEALRPLSGLDRPVADYIDQFPEMGQYLDLQKALMTFVLPFYLREGKQRQNISVGCTGGRHRSVLVVERLAAHIRQLGYRVIVIHRDLNKDPVRRDRMRREASDDA